MLTSLNLRHQTLRPVATLDGCDASQGSRITPHVIRLQSFTTTCQRVRHGYVINARTAT